MIYLLALLSAKATSNLELWAQGSFTAVEPVEQLKKKRDKAKQETLDASNMIIQALAASKLEGKPHICTEYQFHTAQDTMVVTCDARPTIQIKLDGSPTKYPREGDTDLEIIASVQGNTIVQSFQGDVGGLAVTYIFSAEMLTVTKTISSSYLGKPLSITMQYQRQGVPETSPPPLPPMSPTPTEK